MDFPVRDLMTPTARSRLLLDLLRPGGWRCPTCRPGDALTVHDRHRPPVLDDRGRHCRVVFTAYTGPPPEDPPPPAATGTPPAGFWPGTPTARLARELGCDRKHLLELRHRLQGLAEAAAANTGPVAGNQTVADELCQNAGEERVPHLAPDDPPRGRGKTRRGHGTYTNDRPPVAGVVSRATGEVVLRVVEHTARATLTAFVTETTDPAAVVYTDEWGGDAGWPEGDRSHATVCHTPGEREWARGDDGDGIREVPDDTL